MSRCIWVVGPQCHGNSVIGGILHHLGVYMGDNLATPNEHNPKGSYCDQDFFRGCLALNGRYLPKECRVVPDNITAYFDALIAKREREHELWGINLPELCLAGAYLYDRFEDLRILFTNRRDFKQSVLSHSVMSQGDQSAATRHDWPLEASVVLQAWYWLGQQELAERIGRAGITAHAIDKEDIVATPDRAVEFIANFVYDGLTIEPTLNQIQNAVNWVDPKLHHHYET